MWYRIKILLVFALLGPIVGGLVACPILMCVTGACTSTPTDAGASLAACLTFGPIFGFVLGIVPAGLTGAVLAVVRPAPERRNLVWVIALSIVVSACFAFVLLVGRNVDSNDLSGSLLLGAAMLAAAAVAGAVCWWVVARQWRGPVGPDAAPGPPTPQA